MGGEKIFGEYSKGKFVFYILITLSTVFKIILWMRVIVCTYLAVKLILMQQIYLLKKNSPIILLPNPLLADEDKLSLNTGDSFQ